LIVLYILYAERMI